MHSLILFVTLLVVTLGCFFIDPSHQYANQTIAYHSQFHPLELPAGSVQISAFFSPDYSASTLTSLVESAKSEVLIAIPGFSSWSGCTYGELCYGCYAKDIKQKEKFPVFQALVNAIHRGVHVQIVTNDPAQYGDKQCAGKMSLLTYLAIAGASVRYYTTTGFLHTKFVSVDQGDRLAISSINFSKTSIMSNREAGVLIYGNRAIANFTRAVFDFDNKQAAPIVVDMSQYTSDEIALIRDKSDIPVVVPEKYNFKHCEVDTPAPEPKQVINDAIVSLVASPDFALENLKTVLNGVKTSFQLSIYEVSSTPLCDMLIDMAARGVSLKLFVSHEVFGAEEKKEALECYKKLYSHNIAVKMSHPYCLSYSHQKYWIVDNRLVMMSSGNWRESDYPQLPNTFPPMGSSGYRKVNRDFTIAVSSASGGQNALLASFQKVFDLDYSQGVAYDPNKTTLEPVNKQFLRDCSQDE